MEAILKTALPLVVATLMFGMGMSLRLADFHRITSAPRVALIGLTAQMLLLPAIAFALAAVFPVAPAIAVGAVIVAACPGGSMSNLIVYLIRADVALSVSLTAVTSCLCPFTIPYVVGLALALFAGAGEETLRMPAAATAARLTAITILPVVAGMTVRRLAPGFADAAQRPFRIASIVFLVMVIIMQVIHDLDVLRAQYPATGALAATMMATALLAGYGIARAARLNGAQNVTICIEVGVQNLVLALTVAVTLLGEPALASYTAVYAIVTLVMLALMFATRSLWSPYLRPAAAAP